jgi:6-phosphogluconolactonase (cycloisomerase 2 family)
MSSSSSHLKVLHLLMAAALLPLLMFTTQTAQAQGRTGDVYVLTNQAAGNSVKVFHRDASGRLTFVNTVASGGNGAGTGPDPLESQYPVVLSQDNRLLFAVNAGSDSISVFAVYGDRLSLLQTIGSGGTLPTSLTVLDGLLYVLNAGTPNISGFIIDPATNHLVPLPGSTQGLPGGAAAAPAQVSFRPQGGVLVVPEKGTHMIDTFTLDDQGVAQPGTSFPAYSTGITPFGFDFAHRNVAIISDAAASSGLSSYRVEEDGSLEVISPFVEDGQTAACWVVVTKDGKFAYTSNSASNTISSYSVSPDGSLALLEVVAGSGPVPVDMALSNNSKFLYARNAGDGTITGFRVKADGSLMPVNTVGGLPSGAAGIIAR